MVSQEPFEIIYDSETFQHIIAIDRKYHSLIRSTIEEQLSYEPEEETRNRKPLLRPSEVGATWELRFGQNNRFRVFYRTDLLNKTVFIRVIATKLGNKLFTGTEEFNL